MLFDTENELNAYFDQLMQNISSKNGQKMKYFYQQISSDIFLTNFDKFSYLIKDRPYHKNLIKYEEGYLYAKVMGDIDKNLGDFDYRINSHGFRNKHLETLDKNKINILAAGCSVTYGMALPESYTWPQILKEKIVKVQPNINIDNIAVTGIDSVQEIRNIYLYIEKYGKPDFIFFCLPPIYRYPNLDKQYNQISTMQQVGWIPKVDMLEDYIYNNHKDIAMHIFNNILSIRNLEQYCKDLKINLKWFSWDESSQEFYRLRNFKNLLNYKYQNKYTNINKEKYWDHARDDSHLGKKFHLEFADMFFDEWVANEI